MTSQPTSSANTRHATHFKLYTSMADVTIQFQSELRHQHIRLQQWLLCPLLFGGEDRTTCSELPESPTAGRALSHPALTPRHCHHLYQCYPGFEAGRLGDPACVPVGSFHLERGCCRGVRKCRPIPELPLLKHFYYVYYDYGPFADCSYDVCRDPVKCEHSRKVVSGSRLIVGPRCTLICNKGLRSCPQAASSPATTGSSSRAQWSERDFASVGRYVTQSHSPESTSVLGPRR
ncbi:unnamed protein product [Pleuronectes platessa]|uniref:Uncharacterized protein n=1 Tax=Pleuronectes platessa TaxID=8262 RepID=A0A9N7UX71_PLEPL|nr:unnamed protein product [Pleuronectes platessa]